MSLTQANRIGIISPLLRSEQLLVDILEVLRTDEGSVTVADAEAPEDHFSWYVTIIANDIVGPKTYRLDW